MLQSCSQAEPKELRRTVRKNWWKIRIQSEKLTTCKKISARACFCFHSQKHEFPDRTEGITAEPYKLRESRGKPSEIISQFAIRISLGVKPVTIWRIWKIFMALAKFCCLRKSLRLGESTGCNDLQQKSHFKEICSKWKSSRSHSPG
jgi:hypothetical protein